MFNKLRNKIILITMAITTTVLILAGASIMFFTSAIRPEPKPLMSVTIIETPTYAPSSSSGYSDQELQDFIANDRREGSLRLLVTLLCVGTFIEIVVFILSYYLSNKIVTPVEDAYDKQKILIANASHELKTPLAVIEANIEALEVSKDDQKWKTNIETEITHANKLVLDLLQLAKMDAGTITASTPVKLDLSAVINERIELFQPKFSGQITFHNKSKSPVFTLPKQDFLQVLDILLDNATKYGHQRIAIILSQSSLTITSDGATIATKDLDKIFDRFYQTDKSNPGSGLGLAIAKAICDQNNWQISCTSSTRQTKFTISLPRGL